MSELVRMAAARLRANGMDAEIAERIARSLVGPAALRREAMIDAMTPEELARIDEAMIDRWAEDDVAEDSS